MIGYAAFLRAVNVGGHGKLAMNDLRAAAGDAGFHEARTYLASGNLVFHSDLSTPEAKSALSTALTARIGAAPDLVLRDAETLGNLLNGLPFAKAAGSRVGIVFDTGPVDADSLEATTGRSDEEVAIHAHHLVIHYPSGMGRSKLRHPALASGTTRNRNTVEAVAAMVGVETPARATR